ncbi:hypothetical protein KP509_23G023700 [Ceratopteris richardii]|uniref:Ionotropic glutamate receptor L-glutamate and glycine-binding domain-containing protein n=1 Tax=Ceratopteris richardii TaxID=49495 RepID=A0A8T2S0F1_CERRI|nr:hypothetical protein KP509_23G023700 [Ceratopteris richardii]
MARKCKNILLDTDVESGEKRATDSLRVAVPWKTGYTEFVKFQPERCCIGGFSVQVFKQAVLLMEQNSSALRYQFVLHGNGSETKPYDEMLDMLTNKTVDMVVADLTITKNRLEKNVSFTVPYMATKLAMVTPYSYGSDEEAWDFTKPFSINLWITLLMSLLVTGAALYFLEVDNPDFFARVHNSGSLHTCASTRPTFSSCLFDPRHENPPTSGSSSDARQDNLVPVRSQSGAPPQSDGPAFSASSSQENHIQYNDVLLQHVGAPIFDKDSHIRRFKNAFW